MSLNSPKMVEVDQKALRAEMMCRHLGRAMAETVYEPERALHAVEDEHEPPTITSMPFTFSASLEKFLLRAEPVSAPATNISLMFKFEM